MPDGPKLPVVDAAQASGLILRSHQGRAIIRYLIPPCPAIAAAPGHLGRPCAGAKTRRWSFPRLILNVGRFLGWLPGPLAAPRARWRPGNLWLKAWLAPVRLAGKLPARGPLLFVRPSAEEHVPAYGSFGPACWALLAWFFNHPGARITPCTW